MTEGTTKKDVKKTDRQFIVFTLSNQNYGIDIMQSREILTINELTVIPEAPDFVRGVINLRGEIVPVVNLLKKFNLKGGESDKDNRIIIISINESLIGIEVNEVKEIVRVTEDNINNTPNIVQNVDKEYIEGIAKVDKTLLVLLDTQSIFSKSEVETLNDID